MARISLVLQQWLTALLVFAICFNRVIQSAFASVAKAITSIELGKVLLPDCSFSVVRPDISAARLKFENDWTSVHPQQLNL